MATHAEVVVNAVFIVYFYPIPVVVSLDMFTSFLNFNSNHVSLSVYVEFFDTINTRRTKNSISK